MRERGNYKVRRATIADLDSLVPLFDAYRQFYRKASDTSLARLFLRERLQNNESVIFLAIDSQERAVGFAQLYPSFSSVSAARIFILNDLFVAPEARQNGVARQLLATAKEFGQTEGATRMTLSTEVTNANAQKLYQSEGWMQQTDFYTYQLNLARD